MFRLKLFIASLLVVLGCADPKDVPDDFEFLASYNSVQPGSGGGYSVLIKKRAAKEELFVVTVNRDTTARKFFRTKAEVNKLYQELIERRVFKMNSSYANMGVLDGENTTLSIQANGRRKEIHMRNIVPAELKSVFNVLNTLTSHK
jgi:hypothetical protein